MRSQAGFGWRTKDRTPGPRALVEGDLCDLRDFKGSGLVSDSVAEDTQRDLLPRYLDV